jgi:hypothetical protein
MDAIFYFVGTGACMAVAAAALVSGKLNRAAIGVAVGGILLVIPLGRVCFDLMNLVNVSIGQFLGLLLLQFLLVAVLLLLRKWAMPRLYLRVLLAPVVFVLVLGVEGFAVPRALGEVLWTPPCPMCSDAAEPQFGRHFYVSGSGQAFLSYEPGQSGVSALWNDGETCSVYYPGLSGRNFGAAFAEDLSVLQVEGERDAETFQLRLYRVSRASHKELWSKTIDARALYRDDASLISGNGKFIALRGFQLLDAETGTELPVPEAEGSEDAVFLHWLKTKDTAIYYSRSTGKLFALKAGAAVEAVLLATLPGLRTQNAAVSEDLDRAVHSKGGHVVFEDLRTGKQQQFSVSREDNNHPMLRPQWLGESQVAYRAYGGSLVVLDVTTGKRRKLSPMLIHVDDFQYAPEAGVLYWTMETGCRTALYCSQRGYP